MKIVLLTSSRADYGIYRPLIKKLKTDSFFDLQIVAFGTHLSHFHGYTVQEIEKDGFEVNYKIESLVLGDSPEAISSAIGLTVVKFSSFWAKLKSEVDLIICLGDRYEMLAAVLASVPFQIPVAHLHGGESTEGLIDEPIRHSITKMSHIHFASTEKYKQRIIQLGEQPNYVFNVGALGVEGIKNIDLLSKKEFENSINFKLNKYNILITFHPVTLEHNTSEIQMSNLLDALDELKETHFIFTKPNTDTFSSSIIELIDKFVSLNAHRAVSFMSLGQLRYFSALNYVDLVIGNSSSGIVEVPSFKIPTINIGDRQKGRIKADSVLDCEPNKNSIKITIERVLSPEFQKQLAIMKNPYDGGSTSEKILNIIKNLTFDTIIKKTFYDLSV